MDFHGDTYCIYLVAEATYIHSQLRELAVRFALLALAVMLLGLAMVRYLVGRTLRPLSALSEAAGSVAAGNYGQRVPVSSADEVGMLALDFNRMALAVESYVAALQERTERQKLFTAAVTHELKTPLTSLLLNVNTLQTVYLPEENQAALLESMDHKLRWLDTMVRKLLMLLSVKKERRVFRNVRPGASRPGTAAHGGDLREIRRFSENGLPSGHALHGRRFNVQRSC